MIARGERPGYRLVAFLDGLWGRRRATSVVVAAIGRREASDAVRSTVVAVLEVQADAFDIELYLGRGRFCMRRGPPRSVRIVSTLSRVKTRAVGRIDVELHIGDC